MRGLGFVLMFGCVGPCAGRRVSDPAPHGLAWEQLLGAPGRGDVPAIRQVAASFVLPESDGWESVAAGVGWLQTVDDPASSVDALVATAARCARCHEDTPPPPPLAHRHALRAAAWSVLFSAPLEPAWTADPHVGAAFRTSDAADRLADVALRCAACHAPPDP